jgi:hypothetical protein
VSRHGRHASRALLVTALLATCALVATAGCGGGGKPGYCADRSDLQQSVKDLTNLSPSSGVSGLRAQLQKIQSDANALASSAKSDFPSETGALKSSVDALVAAVKALPSNPSPTQVAAIASDASNVIGAVRGFLDATKSACD